MDIDRFAISENQNIFSERTGHWRKAERVCRVDLPVGRRLRFYVQLRLQKYFGSLLTQISSTSSAVPGPHKGAFRDRHERRAGDAMDADALLTNSADADGEVVWS